MLMDGWMVREDGDGTGDVGKVAGGRRGKGRKRDGEGKEAKALERGRDEKPPRNGDLS